MKRIMSLILALAMVLTCAVMPVTSVASDIAVTVTEINAAPGDTVNFDVTLANAPENIGVIEFILTFGDIFSNVSVTYGTVDEMEFPVHTEDYLPDYFRMSCIDTTDMGIDINGVLYSFTATIADDVAPGTYSLDFSGTLIADLDANWENNELECNWQNGVVNISNGETGDSSDYTGPSVVEGNYTGLTVGVPAITAKAGEQVTFDVKLYNAPANIGVLEFILTFGENIFSDVTVTYGTADEMEFPVHTEDHLPTYFRMSCIDTTDMGVDINGTLYTFTATISDTLADGKYDFAFSNGLIADLDANWENNELDALWDAGSLTIVSGTAAPEPAPTYTTTVTNGTATPAGAVEEGTTVTITADPAATGMVFDGWTVVSGGVTLADATAETTTFTMGTANVEVTANYKAMAVDVYVTGGSYTGNAAYGERITITAAAAPAGHEFDKWVVTAGGVILADETAATTTFVMGTEGVAVKATYKKVNYTVSIDTAISGGTITAAPTTATYGDEVTITLTADSGKKLSKLYYTIDGDATEYAINTTLKTFAMPAADVTVHAVFTEITGIIIAGDYRGEAGDLIFTGDESVEVKLTVSENKDGVSYLQFTLDVEDGLTTGTPIFTPAAGIEILDLYDNTYVVWSAASGSAIMDETFVLGTIVIPTVTAKSSGNNAQYKVSVTIDEFMVSNGTAEPTSVSIEDGTVYVSKTIESIKFIDKTTGEAFTAIEVDETEEDKDGFVADYINKNVEYVITYTDGTSDAAKDATADMFADLTTDVTDDMTGGQQATITGSYTQDDTNTTVKADVIVNIALNETIVGITVTPETLYFKVGDTFAWGDAQYTLEQANGVTVGPNAVTAGVQAGTITDDSAALDNTSTAAQTVTVTYADGITDTVTVYFVAPTIYDADYAEVYYEDGATFDAAANNVTLYVSYNETVTGIADEEITTGFDLTAPSLTIAAGTIAATQDVEVEYNGATFTLEGAVIVVNFKDFAGALNGRLTADDTVTGLLKLTPYGTKLVATDVIAVRNIAIRK